MIIKMYNIPTCR